MTIDAGRSAARVADQLFQPYAILPVQHFPGPQRIAPEHLLMMAVVEEAVHCVRKYRVPTDARGRRLFLEARQWLLAPESSWPYCFARICEVLDLDATAVRERLGLVSPPSALSA